jgi:hypothetical protein
VDFFLFRVLAFFVPLCREKEANYSRNKEDAERHNEDDYSSKSAEMEMNRLAPNKRNFHRFPLGAS